MDAKQRRQAGIMIILLQFLIIAGCGFAPSQPYINFRDIEKTAAVTPVAKDSTRPLRIAVAPVLPHKETIGYYRQIAEHLAIQTGRPTELIQRQSNSEVSILLANGGAEIALFSTGTLVSYQSTPELEPLVMQQRNGTPIYYSYIIVPKDSTVNSFAALEGHSFVFTDALSFSGYIFVAHMLRKLGKPPEQFFSRYLFTYSHMKSLRAVATKVADGAAIDSFVYDYAQDNHPELAAAVRIISSSMPVGTGPVVVRKDMAGNQKELLRSIFLNMHFNTDMRQTLKGLMIERFIAPQPEYYHYPRQIVQEMSARP